ncbi:MAG: hypothetical protein AB1Z65_14855 [Candidatus Sulfomarinibacteraceae bacterium]
MDHTTETQIIELLQGEDLPEVDAHLKDCDPCRSLQRLWSDRMDDLRSLDRESLDDSEIHRLRVLYRHLGPAESHVTRWLATLVRSSRTAPSAARGLVTGEIMEYSAGPFNIMLQVGARGPRSQTSVVGQIGTTEADRGIGGTFSVISETGDERFSDVDEFGEFHLEDLPVGTYRGAWRFEDQMLIVPSIEIETDDHP